MNLYGKAAFHLCIVIVALLVPVASAHAQTAKESEPVASDREREVPGDTKREEKPGDIEHLKSRIDKLQSLVEQQQRLLAEMQKRLDDVDGRGRTETASSTVAGVANVGMAEPTNPSPDVNTVPEPTPAAVQSPAQDKPGVLAGWDRNHAFLRSADGTFETQIAGYAQLDYRAYQSGDHPPNSLFLRRARLTFDGKLERYFDFRIEGDFADTSSTILRDLYVNVHRIDEFQLRFGQFRVPFSQEEMRSDNLQDFVERSLVNTLAPSRSPGFMISGVVSKGAFEYQLGAFNGKGLLAPNNNGTPETALRLRFNPWKSGGGFLTRGFIFGGAFTQGRSDGGTSVRGQTESRSFTFFDPDTINGKYIRANGEMTWMLGPAAIRAEYDQTNQRRENLGPGGTNLPGVIAKGYMGQFTYMLTGEEKPEAGVVAPKNSLFTESNGRKGFGAWELKFRYSNLQISDSTDNSNRAESYYFGTNWYLNRFVRYMFDVGFERFKDPARTPNPGDKNFFVVLSRVQVAW